MCIPILRKNQKNRDPTFLTYRTWNIGQRYKVRSSGFLTHIEYAEYQRNRFGNIGLLHSEPANILGGGDIHPPLCSRGLNIFWLKIPQISWHAVCSQFNGAYFVWNTFSPKWIALGWKLRKFQKKNRIFGNVWFCSLEILPDFSLAGAISIMITDSESSSKHASFMLSRFLSESKPSGKKVQINVMLQKQMKAIISN